MGVGAAVHRLMPGESVTFARSSGNN